MTTDEIVVFNPLRRQFYKMVKDSNNSSATVDELFECVWAFCETGTAMFKWTWVDSLLFQRTEIWSNNDGTLGIVLLKQDDFEKH